MLSDQIPPNQRKAVIVRAGEKRILANAMTQVNSLRQKGTGIHKRKGKSDGEAMPSKKAKKIENSGLL